ncbi:MAG: KH domain-containing protein [Promethearchaeota archaeon]
MIRKDRIAVLLGKDGATKRQIEKVTGTRIEVDSKTGDVEVSPDIEHIGNPEDPFADLGDLRVWITKTIVTAINRGFNPKKAMKLVDDSYILEVIDLERLLGKSRKRITRVRGRIIGEHGKMRRTIEELSRSHVSVLGKTVAIIGTYESVRVARKAISLIIEGAPHKVAVSFLRRKNREMKMDEMKRLWRPSFEL